MELNVEFIQHLSDGVAVIDANGIIRAVNPALLELLGKQPDTIIGQPCVEIFNCEPCFSEQTTNLCTSLCDGNCPSVAFNANRAKVVEREVLLNTQVGEPREVRASFTHFPGSGYPVVGVVGYTMLTLRDVTLLRRQEELQQHFIATASHQLRTPLASLKTSISLLLEHTKTDFNPILRRLLENINVSSLRMERIVNDLIELISLQSGQTQLWKRHLEASEIVQQVAEQSQTWLAERQQTLELKVSATNHVFVQADSERISQVLSHLLSNASKFSSPGQKIELSLIIDEKNGAVVFQVRDWGIGIPTHDQPFIFEKFYQVQVVENSQQPSGGLGLPLARLLIELHGGRLWFESAAGQGSTFSFSLPLTEIKPATLSQTSKS